MGKVLLLAKSMITILHISDLHRITKTNVNCLKASFEVEKDYYRANGIPMPSFIVVSGDIIQGSKKDDEAQAREEIQKQYEVAGDFLAGLCDTFFEGKRDRMIIVPGNHDVSQYVSKASMTKIDPDDKETLVDALWNDDSGIRWSWKDLYFYNIIKPEVYKDRFVDFISFYNNFYKDLSFPERKYPSLPDEEAYLVDYPKEGVTFVCFNSCYQLDHLQQCGYICFNALSNLSTKLLEKKRQGRLMIAVWHHHTQGLPKENNYLNYRILDNMSRYGIKLALHGHQHISGILNEYRDVFTKDNLWLVSAGTVYGNSSDMVPGTTRQYNLLTIERQSHNCEVILMSRVDKSLQNPEPVWENGLIGRSQQIQYPFLIPIEAVEQTKELDDLSTEINMINVEVEKSKDYQLASRRLMELDQKNAAVRKFLLEYLCKAEDWNSIVNFFAEPTNPSEAVTFIDSCIKTKDAIAFYRFSESDAAKDIKDASVSAIMTEAKVILKRV